MHVIGEAMPGGARMAIADHIMQSLPGVPPSKSDAELWNAMIAALQAERADTQCDFGSRSDKIGDDARLLQALLQEGEETTRLRLWDNDPHIVISKRLAKLPGAAQACAMAEAEGWPVAVRASGGTAVVHRPGVLNISLLRITHRPQHLSHGFDALCDIIIRAAARVGLTLQAGKLTRSYCAGSHDIGWRGHKIAGTAGVSRRSGKAHGGLFHASLTVHGNWRQDLAVISRFERLAGMAADYDIGSHASLADLRNAGAPAAYSAAARSCLGEQPNFSL